MNRPRPYCLLSFATVLFLGLSASPALGQTKEGAILLLPESDLDQELAEDLNEVLIASLIDKSGKTYRIIGKEVFRKEVGEARLPGGGECLSGTNVECYRKVGVDRSLNLVVVGRVGKAMGGFRLEVTKISTTGIPDRTQRKRVPGELEQLIAEVESLADWILQPDHPYLRVTVSEPGASVTVDGQPYNDLQEPLRVTPGQHTVEATKEGFANASVQVSCEVGKYCEAALEMVAVEVVVDVPVDPTEKKDPVVESSGGRYWPWAVVSGGVAVLSGLGAGYFYLEMNSKMDDIDGIRTEFCPGNVCSITRNEFKTRVDPLVEDGNNAAIGATALATVSILAATGAGVLLVLELLDHSVEPVGDEDASALGRPMLVPMLVPGTAGLQLDITF